MSQSQQATAEPTLNKAAGTLVKIFFGAVVFIGAAYLGYWGYETYRNIEERGVAEALLR